MQTVMVYPVSKTILVIQVKAFPYKALQRALVL